jgi:4'-phosphopantetheinyl transferase
MTIDLWYAAAAPEAAPVLGPEEQLRRDRFLCEQARGAYSRAHSLKRRVLSQYRPSRAPQDWTFVHGPAGKPEVAEAFPHRFNLSHSGSCVALAVARCEVGVDVERRRRLAAAPALAERIFHPREQAWLATQACFDDAFFRMWTLKEALLKAAGIGFSQPPEAVGWHDLDAPWAHAWFAGRRWRGFSACTGAATLAVAVAADDGPEDDVRLLRIDGSTAIALRWTEESLATMTAGA